MIKTKFIYEPELEGERLLHSFQSLIFRRYQGWFACFTLSSGGRKAGGLFAEIKAMGLGES